MNGIEFKLLKKTFPGVIALEDVSFSVERGSVHALCGENGAGKSTLLKIMSGVYVPDHGELKLDGRELGFGSAQQALKNGIAVIYQELNDVLDLSVAENIWLGQLPNKFGILDKKALLTRTRESLNRVGLDISPDVRLKNLSIAQRQMVEIAKALTHQAKVIAFDEPTSSLSSREVDRLFEIIAQLKADGAAILYVSHRMDEIFKICDAATVLRDGRHVQTFPVLGMTSEQGLIECMVGRKISDIFGYEERPIGEVVLRASDLRGQRLDSPKEIEVRAGEIVGIFGLVGAGRSELLRAIYEGDGVVEVDGQRRHTRGPKHAINAGIVLCPEDRKKDGIIPLLSVGENVNLSVRTKNATVGFVINSRFEKKNAEKYVSELKIKTPSVKTPIRNLSGGNQQKVILGRWLSEDIRVILLDEPTRGIDVGAKSEIYAIIQDLAKEGVAVLMVSSELPEVLGLSDRIIVMESGKITGEMNRSDATEAMLLSLALPHAETGVGA